MSDVARMIKAGVGMQVACIDFGDWDMHADLGPIRPDGDTTGDYWFADHLLEFTTAIAAFMQDLGSKMDDVTIVTLTEFGRRVEENDSAGVDHGYATSVMLAGNGVKGGSVKLSGAMADLGGRRTRRRRPQRHHRLPHRAQGDLVQAVQRAGG